MLLDGYRCLTRSFKQKVWNQGLLLNDFVLHLTLLSILFVNICFHVFMFRFTNKQFEQNCRNKFYLYWTVKINTRVVRGKRYREIFRSTRFPLTVILHEAIVWVLNDNNAVVFDCWDWYWYFRSYRCRFCFGH